MKNRQYIRLFEDIIKKLKAETKVAFILNVAAAKNVDTLILGAYGCGVFGQDPYEVARIFRSYLTGEYKYFSKVIFAVPDWKYEIFNKILG